MMTQRFLARVDYRPSMSAGSAAIGNRVVYEAPSVSRPHGVPALTIWTKPGTAGLALPDNSGFILGTLFERNNSTPLDAVPEWFAQAPIEDRATLLTDRFWGGYIACWTTGDNVVVHRDPSGAIPCYCVCLDRCILFATDVDMLLESRMFAPEIDWRALTEQLIAIQYRTDATCLSGVIEVAQGSSVLCSATGLKHQRHWSPWDFGSRERQ